MTDEDRARDIAASLPTYDASCPHSSYNFANSAVVAIATALTAVRAEATLAERETCAKLMLSLSGMRMAAAIRARSAPSPEPTSDGKGPRTKGPRIDLRATGVSEEPPCDRS